MVLARPGARRAYPPAAIAAAGLALCGIEEDPPGVASCNSPTSVADMKTISPVILRIAPATIASAEATFTNGTRLVCQIRGVASRFKDLASAAWILSPCGYVAAKVPLAPP